MPKRNGHNRPPVTSDVRGNAAAQICKVCDSVYIVSVWCDHQHREHSQGWRVCPHCGKTESTVWWAGYYARDDLGAYQQQKYMTAQRKLSPREQKEIADSKPTKISKELRLRHERGKKIGPLRW